MAGSGCGLGDAPEEEEAVVPEAAEPLERRMPRIASIRGSLVRSNDGSEDGREGDGDGAPFVGESDVIVDAATANNSRLGSASSFVTYV